MVNNNIVQLPYYSNKVIRTNMTLIGKEGKTAAVASPAVLEEFCTSLDFF